MKTYAHVNSILYFEIVEIIFRVFSVPLAWDYLKKPIFGGHPVEHERSFLGAWWVKFRSMSLVFE